MSYASLKRDTLWNLAGFGCMALGGVLLNILVARFYGPATLGVFNQVLAVFVFASQISVFGIHYSLLQRLSVASVAIETQEGRDECRQIVTTALVATAFTALPTGLLGLALAPLIGRIFSSPDVGLSWLYILPALVFMAFNKVLLNAINALHHMRAFAIGSSARYVLALIFLAIGTAMGMPGVAIPAVLSGAEILLFLGCALYVFRLLPPALGAAPGKAMRAHLAFGSKGLLSGTVSELNTKADILVLGLFTTDKIVGIYSIASLIFEGLWLVPQVLRNIANPLIARATASKDNGAVTEVMRKIGWPAFWLTAVASVAACLLYGPFVEIAIGDATYREATLPLIILAGGLLVSARWLPLDMLFVQAGQPLTQSAFKMAVFSVNLLLNLALVPFWGMMGAAIGTALAQVASVVFLKIMARRYLALSV